MKFTAWEARRHIEQNYKKALGKLVKFLNGAVKNAESLDEIFSSLFSAGQSTQLHTWAQATSKRMVTNTLEENARTWRQAAAMSGEGKQLYNKLQASLNTKLGDRVRELIDQNAQHIKTVPQDVALQIVRHIGTKAFQGNRSNYTVETFKDMVEHMALNHAKVISRTETAKTHSALVRAQAEETGLDWYIWHTSHDVRVRDSHKKMAGVLCQYSNPPAPEELIGEKLAGHYGPGEIYNCRCYAAPVILWRLVTWPHQVCIGNQIITMSKTQFEQQYGKIGR